MKQCPPDETFTCILFKKLLNLTLELNFCVFPPLSFFCRFMIKRAQGRNRFGIKNFKKRWFRLTNHEFTYHKTKGGLNEFPRKIQLRSTFTSWWAFLCDSAEEGVGMCRACTLIPQHTWCRFKLLGRQLVCAP